MEISLVNKRLEIANKELTVENRLIKEAITKLEQSIAFGEENRKTT